MRLLKQVKQQRSGEGALGWQGWWVKSAKGRSDGAIKTRFGACGAKGAKSAMFVRGANGNLERGRRSGGPKGRRGGKVRNEHLGGAIIARFRASGPKVLKMRIIVGVVNGNLPITTVPWAGVYAAERAGCAGGGEGHR
jgi:hypothetical protein